MKKDGPNKFFITMAFLVISLFAANTFILNSNFSGFSSLRMSKSILNSVKSENTISKINGSKEDGGKRIKPYLQEDENEKSTLDKEGESEGEEKSGKGEHEEQNNEESLERILDGTDSDDCEVSATPAAASGKALIESSTGRLLYGENEHAKCYPASTTKALTAYIALKTLPLDRVVTVPKEAAGVEGSSIYLKAGQLITVEDLLYGLMLRSGNDAATALALEISGSIAAFAALMNETAAALGATNSHFVNPHGLHDDEHYTTPYDLALICAAAYSDPRFQTIVSSKVRTIRIDGEAVAIANKNKLLKLYDGANGVKTGYTKRSGRCLIGGAKRQGMQLISVVLNCPDMWNDTERLLDYGFSNYKMMSVEQGLLRALTGEGKTAVEIDVAAPVDSDWSNVFYPLKDDEYVVLKKDILKSAA